mgnify:CR=1 FL=1
MEKSSAVRLLACAGGLMLICGALAAFGRYFIVCGLLVAASLGMFAAAYNFSSAGKKEK